MAPGETQEKDAQLRSEPMPMINVYAPSCVFEDKHDVAQRLAGALMTIEGVPDITMLRNSCRSQSARRKRLIDMSGTPGR